MDKKKLCKCCTAGWILCLIGGISIPLVSYFIHKQVEKVSIYKHGIIKLIQTLTLSFKI